uniref:Uncharacterized protein n=1 Tax=Echinococcus granulosus TaxID=6210 RepID=A0A068WZE5_ECHGR|nr:hypothetical protein EgrG_002046900 [Echinococcus granulosus]
MGFHLVGELLGDRPTCGQLYFNIYPNRPLWLEAFVPTSSRIAAAPSPSPDRLRKYLSTAEMMADEICPFYSHKWLSRSIWHTDIQTAASGHHCPIINAAATLRRRPTPLWPRRRKSPHK